MGDQRRRNKSRGCQKEWEDQEEGEERVGGYMQVYAEWVWPLFTVHSGKGGRGGASRRRGQGMGGAGDRQRRGSKE